MPTSPFSPRNDPFGHGQPDPWRAPRRRGVFSWLFGWISGLVRFVLAVVLFFTLMTFFVYWLVGHVFIPPGDLLTPELTGKPFLEAAKLLRDQNLSIKWEGDQPSESIAEGSIVSQQPAPNTPIKKGTAVKVMVSGGVALVNLPDVRRSPQNRAQWMLSKAGLVVGQRTMLPSPADPPGTVLETDPPAGTGVPQGSRVNLLVATGETRITQSMPNLQGMRLDQAREVLTDAGLFATEVQVAMAGAGAGQVVSQTPAAGEAVSDSTHIVLKYTPMAAGPPAGAESGGAGSMPAATAATTETAPLDDGAIPALTMPGVTGAAPEGETTGTEPAQTEPVLEEFPAGDAVGPGDLEQPAVEQPAAEPPVEP